MEEYASMLTDTAFGSHYQTSLNSTEGSLSLLKPFIYI